MYAYVKLGKILVSNRFPFSSNIMTGGASPNSQAMNKLYIGNLDYKVQTEVCFRLHVQIH